MSKEKPPNINQLLEFVARRKKELKKKGIVVSKKKLRFNKNRNYQDIF